MKTILVTVADDRSGRKGGIYGATQDYIELLFKTHLEFGITDFLSWKWEDIKNSKYYEIYKHRLDITDPEINGRLYKPLAIRHALDSIEDGDFLIYNDVSPELWTNISNINWNLYNVDILKNLCIKNGGILTAHAQFDHDGIKHLNVGPNEVGFHVHEIFTKPECRNIMDPDAKYLYCLQHASGFIVMKKSKNVIDFVDEWIYYNSNPECCEVSPIHPHRSDQSISGILINKMENKLIRCLLGQHQHLVINPYNLLSFSQKNTEYKFIDSIQPMQNKFLYIDENKSTNILYKDLDYYDNWCVTYR